MRQLRKASCHILQVATPVLETLEPSVKVAPTSQAPTYTDIVTPEMQAAAQLDTPRPHNVLFDGWKQMISRPIVAQSARLHLVLTITVQCTPPGEEYIDSDHAHRQYSSQLICSSAQCSAPKFTIEGRWGEIDHTICL